MKRRKNFSWLNWLVPPATTAVVFGGIVGVATFSVLVGLGAAAGVFVLLLWITMPREDDDLWPPPAAA